MLHKKGSRRGESGSSFSMFSLWCLLQALPELPPVMYNPESEMNTFFPQVVSGQCSITATEN